MVHVRMCTSPAAYELLQTGTIFPKAGCICLGLALNKMLVSNHETIFLKYEQMNLGITDKLQSPDTVGLKLESMLELLEPFSKCGAPPNGS